MSKYWLTPPEIYSQLNGEFEFDFDPCPCPLPNGYNGLNVPWGKSNYVNPPFRAKDCRYGSGPTAFVHKAIAEHKHGNGSVLVLPVQSYVMLLAEAGAEIRSMGRIRWLEAETGEPCRSPSPICAFILRGNAPQNNIEAQNTSTNKQSTPFKPCDKCESALPYFPYCPYCGTHLAARCPV